MNSETTVRIETLEGICRRLEDEVTSWETKCDDARARILALSAALSALIARVRRTGGYATPEEQDVLRAAEQALAGGAENRSSEPVASVSGTAASDAAGQRTELASVRSGGGR